MIKLEKDDMLAALQGNWLDSEKGFEFTIEGESVFIKGVQKSVLGLKDAGSHWQISLQPLGALVLFIKSIDKDKIELIHISGSEQVVKLSDMDVFAIIRISI